MKSTERREKRYIGYTIAAFLLPVLSMTLVYAVRGIYPFGEVSVLAVDLNNQYVNFFAYLKSVLQGNHGMTYTFSKTLGGDMIGLSAYYLLSPWNLLFVSFPVEKFYIAVEIITLIKLGLCGSAFYILISERKNAGWTGLIFSTAYALSAYNIMYQQNIMWIDGVILLPFVVLGIQKIMRGKAPFLYAITLFAAIVTNYYIGYMICIFSVLFFAYSVWCEGKNAAKISVFRNYILSSFLGGGLAMWLLIPVLKSLAGGKAEFDLSILTLEPNFHWSDFLVKIFNGSGNIDQIVAGLPNVFFTMTALLFLILFFLNRKINIWKKTAAAVVLIILYLSFYLKGPNLIWHAFNTPAWFPYRYSFVFVFFVLWLAWEGFQEADLLENRERCILSAVAVSIVILAACWMYKKQFTFMSIKKYALNIGMAVLAAVSANLFWGMRQSNTVWKRSVSRICAAGMVLLVCAEVCSNGIFSIESIGYKSAEEYETYMVETSAAVGYVKAQDDSFYRLEKTFNRKECDPMALDYNGLSHYSSTEKQAVKNFMGQMGFRNNGNWSYYNRGSTYAADSVLGVKYVLSKKELGAPYELVETVGNIMIYQNPYAFSIGFMADESILEFDEEEDHKFAIQNHLFSALCNEVEQDLFVPELLEGVTLNNLYQEDAESGYYYKKDTESEASVTFTFTAKTANPVFAYLGTNDMQKVKIYVNGKKLGKYFDVYQYDIMRLGNFEAGESVSVEVVLEKDYVNITDVWVYYQDMEVTEQYYDELSSGQVLFEETSDTWLRGTVTNDGGSSYAFFTIPMEDAWYAYVDGVQTEIKEAGIFMAVAVPEGTHEIELRYIPNGRKAGVALSGISLVCLIVWMILYYRKEGDLKCHRTNKPDQNCCC